MKPLAALTTTKAWRLLSARSRELIHDERGQSTTEYILILSVVVMIAMKFKQNFQSRLLKLIDKVGNDMDQAASSE